MLLSVTNYITNLTNWPAISIEQSPSWEANRFSAIQEIPGILWDQKFHCRIHKRPPSVLFLNQTNPVDAFPSKFLKIHFSNIISSKTRVSKLAFSVRCPPTTPSMHLYFLLSVPPASPLSFFLVCWTEYCLVRCLDHQDSHCAVVCAVLLLRPS